MMLEEANALLKKSINEEQLQKVGQIYALLAFDKPDFCKLIDAIGIDKWTIRENRWTFLDEAERGLQAKNQYLDAKKRLEELENEKQGLEQIVNNYKPLK
ncbi:MAG: hypothetical protein ACYDG2_25140 [Ruminiclostridium sp.]